MAYIPHEQMGARLLLVVRVLVYCLVRRLILLLDLCVGGLLFLLGRALRHVKVPAAGHVHLRGRDLVTQEHDVGAQLRQLFLCGRILFL